MPISAGVFQCAGADKKLNFLIVRHVPGAQRCVVFFPGDISDFAAGLKPYNFCLEALLWVLCLKFPEDTVILVKPRMMVDHFAIYVNFMLVDGTGNPRSLTEKKTKSGQAQADEQPADLEGPSATEHLCLLLRSLGRELGEELPRHVILVGFSKGAAVLNALMRDPQADLWATVHSVHFVDAGLMIPGVFPTSEQELQRLGEVTPDDFTVWLHSTPRQLKDENRPFVAAEHAAFEERCKAIGQAVETRLYAEGMPVSLDMHFDALRCFFTGQDDEDGGDRHCGFFQAWQASAEAAEMAAS
eukprot:gb/GFBE01020272.1/.p1 GENE.gb/GFBE01020272.1/~~gb/GFBE01020272.1/.p1  ORF type:complete len:300 (+),score=66.51 gb/GFBE01020272.1/:1-900(+)